MFKEAASRVKAVAYVDRSYKDKIMSDHADQTYLRGIEVNSFDSMEEAFQWIKQFGPLPQMRLSIS